MMHPVPLTLGLIALLAGVLAFASALFSTSQERKRLAGLPLHQVRIEVDGQASSSLEMRSGAKSPQELADRIAHTLHGAL